MKGGGYFSEDEVIREALRVYELIEQEDNDPQLAAALRHALRSPLKNTSPAILPPSPREPWWHRHLACE